MQLYRRDIGLILLASAALSGTAAMSARAQETAQAGATSPGGIEEVVVTSQRRSENVQKSSLAIQVLSAEQLQNAGVTQATGLGAVVPGLQIGQTGSVTQIFIRGVGDISTNPTNNPAVAVDVDGIYVARPSDISTNFFDIARIEVLKGPQGTLYGRNASGGAINLITTSPSLDKIGGYAEAEIGNYALKKFDAAINVPISDTFAVRGAVRVVERDGFITDGTNDQSDQEGRIRALWQPNDDISLRLNFDAAHEGGKGSGFVMLPLVDRGNSWTSISSAQSNAILQANSPFPAIISQGQNSKQDNRFYNVSAELNWDLKFATLTILPAFRKSDENYSFWPGWYFSQQNVSDETTVEARLSKNTDALKWVAGLYYFNEDQTAHGAGITSELFQNISLSYKPTNDAYAAFGQATYSVTDALRLIGGVRYTIENKGLTGTTYDESPLTGPNRLAETYGPGGEKFRATNWKAGFEYDLTPQNMLYFTASTGFKAGGLNLSAAPNGYAPEKLTAYEFGARNRFFENRLQINPELYWWDYSNKQESSVTLTPGGNFSDLVKNAGSATIKGASLDMQFRPTGSDRLRAFAEYNYATYNKFIYQTVAAIFNPAGTGCAFTPGGATVTVNCSGFQLVHAPKWTGSIGYEHYFDLSNEATIVAGTDIQLSSGYWLAPDFSRNERASGYATANVNLSYTSADDAWSVTAFVQNITDRAVYTGGTQLPLQAPLFAANINPPRTYGGRFRYNF